MSKIVENGTMYLKNVFSEFLPEKFKTQYSLDCNDSELTFLPDGLEVGGDLIIGNAYIEDLPEDLFVTGNLIMLHKTLEVPDSAIIGGKIITKNGYLEPKNTNEKHCIITNNGEKILFKNKKQIMQESNLPNDFYFPKLIFLVHLNCVLTNKFFPYLYLLSAHSSSLSYSSLLR